MCRLVGNVEHDAAVRAAKLDLDLIGSGRPHTIGGDINFENRHDVVLPINLNCLNGFGSRVSTSSPVRSMPKLATRPMSPARRVGPRPAPGKRKPSKCHRPHGLGGKGTGERGRYPDRKSV